jgi:hypothetical protein
MTGDGQAWVPRMVNFGCSAIVPECGQVHYLLAARCD